MYIANRALGGLRKFSAITNNAKLKITRREIFNFELVK